MRGNIFDKIVSPAPPSKKLYGFGSVLIRMFANFGGELVFSADLCYNGTNRKPPSEREVGML